MRDRVAAVPRVQCPEHGVREVNVPWAEPDGNFTAMFEALVIDRLKVASFSAVAVGRGPERGMVESVRRPRIVEGRGPRGVLLAGFRAWAFLCACVPGCVSDDLTATSNAGKELCTAGSHRPEAPASALEAHYDRRLHSPGVPPMNFGDIAFDPVGVRYPGKYAQPEVYVMTEGEFVTWAISRARDEGWDASFRCTIVVGCGTPGERRIVVDPLTSENLKVLNFEMKEVDWVILSPRR